MDKQENIYKTNNSKYYNLICELIDNEGLLENNAEIKKFFKNNNELSLTNLIDIQINEIGNFAKNASSGNSAQNASSGDYAKNASSGDYAKNASSGNSAKNASSGNFAQNASSGDYAKNASSGNSAQNASSGNSAKNASSGNFAKNASSGNSAQNASSGNSAQNASSGNSAQNASSGNSAKNASSGNSAKNASSGNSAKNASSGNFAKNASSGNFAKNASSGNSAQNASSGNSAQNASSGDSAQNASSGNFAQNASSGDYAKNASSGDYAKNASSGNSAKNASSGNFAKNASSGNSAKNASSGNFAQNASSGDSAQNASSGNSAQNASSGDYAKNVITGKNSVCVDCGINGLIKGIKGTWIALTEFRENKDGILIPYFIKSAIIGDKKYKDFIGNELKENVFYGLVNKKFTEIEEIDGSYMVVFNTKEKAGFEILETSYLEDFKNKKDTKQFVVKKDGYSAHGQTIKLAMKDCLKKIEDNMPLEQKINMFLEKFNCKEKYSGHEFFEWHSKLTKSCDTGRKRFIEENNLSLDDLYTVKEFINLTENAYYGFNEIKELKRVIKEKIGETK